MNHRAWPDGDVAFEIDILANDRFRMDRKLVPSEITAKVNGQLASSVRCVHSHGWHERMCKCTWNNIDARTLKNLAEVNVLTSSNSLVNLSYPT